LNYARWRTRIPIREFKSESDNLPISGPNGANLSASTSLVSLCYLGLHQAAPAHNHSITGAALWHRVAPNSATAAAYRSNLAARLRIPAPANGGRLTSQSTGLSESSLSAETSAAETGEQKLQERTSANVRWNPRNRALVPASKLWSTRRTYKQAQDWLRSPSPSSGRHVFGWGSHPSDQAPAARRAMKAT
jgi:hypothetical protein